MGDAKSSGGGENKMSSAYASAVRNMSYLSVLYGVNQPVMAKL